MINRQVFFRQIQRELFKEPLGQTRIDSMSSIIDEWEARGLTDLRWLAYMFATTTWETAYTMLPIREYGLGRGREYGIPDPVTGKTYYGRGFVQLTWKSNYERMSKVVDADLVNEPDLAMVPAYATKILFEGMIRGMFTGVGLPRYFHDDVCDWYNARRIVNGLDRAKEISDLAVMYYAALTPHAEA